MLHKGWRSVPVPAARMEDLGNVELIPLNPNTIMTSHDTSSKPEFGTWMLVTRRRGHARGRSDSHRASHVTLDVADDGQPNSPHSRTTVGRGTHGGLQARGRGGFIASCA